MVHGRCGPRVGREAHRARWRENSGRRGGGRGRGSGARRPRCGRGGAGEARARGYPACPLRVAGHARLGALQAGADRAIRRRRPGGREHVWRHRHLRHGLARDPQHPLQRGGQVQGPDPAPRPRDARIGAVAGGHGEGHLRHRVGGRHAARRRTPPRRAPHAGEDRRARLRHTERARIRVPGARPRDAPAALRRPPHLQQSAQRFHSGDSPGGGRPARRRHPDPDGERRIRGLPVRAGVSP